MCSSLPHFDRSSYEEPSYEEGFEEIVKVNFVPNFKDDCIKELYMQFLYWLLLERNEVKISTKKSHHVRSSGFRIVGSGILSFAIRNPVKDWNPEFTGFRNPQREIQDPRLSRIASHGSKNETLRLLGFVLSLDDWLYMFRFSPCLRN